MPFLQTFHWYSINKPPPKHLKYFTDGFDNRTLSLEQTNLVANICIKLLMKPNGVAFKRTPNGLRYKYKDLMFMFFIYFLSLTITTMLNCKYLDRIQRSA
jgi:hypothetical protein